MKKHVKKIICVVALLVVCLAAFLVPSAAYWQTTDNVLFGVNPVTPIITRTDRLSGEIFVDVIPSAIHENDNNDTSSDVYSIDEIYMQDDDVYLVSYVPSNIGYDNYWTSLIIPDYVVHVGDVAYYNQFEFYGVYSFDYTLTYVPYLSIDTETFTSSIETTSIDEGYWRFSDLMPESWDDNGLIYVSIDNFVINPSYEFSIVVPYYGDGVTPMSLLDIDAVRPPSPVVIDDIPMGEFLWNSISGFLSFEIIPNVTLYHVFVAIIAIPLFIWFLKLFAGG